MPSKAYTEAAKEAPKFAVLHLSVNGKGEIIKATDAAGNDLTAAHHKDSKKRTIKKHAVLATENWCRWVLQGGRWV